MSEARSPDATLQGRQVVLVGLGAAALLVLLGGLAWACVPYHGTVSVYPVNAGGQATMGQSAYNERPVTVHGGVGQIDDDGNRRRGMIWCDGSGGFDEGEPYRAGAIRPSESSPDLLLAVDRMSGCTDDENDALPTGDYNVIIRPAIFGDDGTNPGFDKNAITQDDRIDSCFFNPNNPPEQIGAANHEGGPRPGDYIHPEPLVLGPDGGSIMIDDITVAPSSSVGFDNVAGLCINSNEHSRVNVVPLEILDDQPVNGRGRR